MRKSCFSLVLLLRRRGAIALDERRGLILTDYYGVCMYGTTKQLASTPDSSGWLFILSWRNLHHHRQTCEELAIHGCVQQLCKPLSFGLSTSLCTIRCSSIQWGARTRLCLFDTKEIRLYSIWHQPRVYDTDLTAQMLPPHPVMYLNTGIEHSF